MHLLPAALPSPTPMRTAPTGSTAGSPRSRRTGQAANICKLGGRTSEAESTPLPRADSPAERPNGFPVQPIPAVQSHGMLATETSRRAFGQLEALYETPLPATRTGALYNAFSYPTKISPE